MAHPNKHPLCRPWTSAELENLSQYAVYTDSIATIRSLLIARRDPDAPMPNAPIVPTIGRSRQVHESLAVARGAAPTLLQCSVGAS